MKKRDVLAICYCNFCRSAIRFSISRAGEIVNCPQCMMETVLYAPNGALPYSREKYVLEAAGIKWTRNDWGIRMLVGEMANKSTTNMDWVRIEFVLYDDTGMPVGSTSDCFIGFHPGQVWAFQCPVFEKEVLAASTPVISCEYGKIRQTDPLSASQRVAQLAAS